MNNKTQENYAKYIRAYLIKSGKLKNVFRTLTPTERQIDKYRNEVDFSIKSSVASHKSVEKLFRNQVETPTIKTLNYIAELFKVEPYDIDEFYKAWNNGHINEEDLLIPDNQENKYKLSKINSFIRKYNEIISDILPIFVGRKFVFDKVDEFISKNNKGYFYIKANPGIGKTSLAIKLVEENGYAFHIINPQHNGADNSVKDFISNICAQLIVKYNLPIEQFPEDYNQDGSFLFTVLHLISEKVDNNEKVVIVIDGLDELRQEELTFFAKETILYLPKLLPRNIFFIVTMRKLFQKGIKLPTSEVNKKFLIEDLGKDNIKDVREYIKISSNDERFEQYLKKHKISKLEFLHTLEKKSEGNFMYLKYIFREILKGDYKDIKLEELPQGLEGYYKEHWDRMMTEADGISEDTKLKTIYVIANIGEPISSKDLTEILKSDDETIKNIHIRKVINNWWQFLRETINDEDGEKEYTFYHKSFLDFLASDDMIDSIGKDYSKIAEKVELNYYDQNIDELLEEDDL